MANDKLTVGDWVVSFDFPFRRDCYIEGKVLEVKPDGRIIIAVSRQVFAGSEVYGVAGPVVSAPEFGWLDGRRMVFLKGTEGDFDTSPV